MTFPSKEKTVISISVILILAAVGLVIFCRTNAAKNQVNDEDAIKNVIAVYYRTQCDSRRDLKYHDLSGVVDKSSKPGLSLMTFSQIMTERIRYTVMKYLGGKDNDDVQNFKYTLKFKNVKIVHNTASLVALIYLKTDELNQWFTVPSYSTAEVYNVFYLKKASGKWKITDYVIPFEWGDIRQENQKFDLAAIHKAVDKEYGHNYSKFN